MKEVISQYYDGPGLLLPGYQVQSDFMSGQVSSFNIGPLRHEEEVDQAAVVAKLEETSQSLRSIHHNGSFFEIAEANADVLDVSVMLHISTFSSSISGNAGNAYEFAAQAVRYPSHRHLYVASFGNGGTGALTAKERRYARKTGRFTWEQDAKTVPLPSVQNLQTALAANGLSVTRLMGTDSAGGPYASALGLAMEEGQLTHAFFSERSGFVTLSKSDIVRGMIYAEHKVNNPRNKQISPDANSLSDEMIKQAEDALACYETCENRQNLRQHMTGKKDMLASLWTSAQAVRRGPSKKENPLVEDTLALQARQPDAHLTFGMAERDRLYKNTETSHKAAKLFLSQLALRGGTARVVMVPQMTHAYNTYFPSLYHAIKREALGLA